MSYRAVDWAISQPVGSVYERAVLMVLAWHYNDKTGQCNPSQKTLADEVSASVSSVRRALSSLEEKGLISKKVKLNAKKEIDCTFYKLHFSEPIHTDYTSSQTEQGSIQTEHTSIQRGQGVYSDGTEGLSQWNTKQGTEQVKEQVSNNEDSSLSRLGEFPNADDPETLPYDEAPLFDDYPELDEQALQIEDDCQTEKVQTRKPKKARIPPCPYEQFVELYETKCPTLPKIQLITETRKRNIKARWEQVAKQNELTDAGELLKFFSDFFDVVNESRFLTGQITPSDPNKRPWKASLEWLTKESNFIKVIERRYDN